MVYLKTGILNCLEDLHLKKWAPACQNRSGRRIVVNMLQVDLGGDLGTASVMLLEGHQNRVSACRWNPKKQFLASRWTWKLLVFCLELFQSASVEFFHLIPLIPSPWYNRTSWLGVKHQLTYLPFNSDHQSVLHRQSTDCCACCWVLVGSVAYYLFIYWSLLYGTILRLTALSLRATLHQSCMHI